MVEEIASTETEEYSSFGTYIKAVIKAKGVSIHDFAAQISVSEMGQKYYIKENRVYKILEDKRIPNVIEFHIIIEVSGADPIKAYNCSSRFYTYALKTGLIEKLESRGDQDEEN